MMVNSAILVMVLVAGVSCKEYDLTGLHVKGNQFVNQAGQEVILRVSGVNRTLIC